MSRANGFANGIFVQAVRFCSLSASSGVSTETSAPPMISSARVVATWRSASKSVCTYCFIVKATSAWPIRALSAFQSIFASRAAVA